MNIKNLIIGSLLLISGIVLLFWDNDKKSSKGMLRAIQTKLNITRIGMIIIGVYIIIRELSKIL